MVPATPSTQKKSLEALLNDTTRNKYRSAREFEMRIAIEGWLRDKVKDVRVIHELVLGRGLSIIDMAGIGPASITAVEIKSNYDVTTRLFHQIAYASLSCGEVWLALDRKGNNDSYDTAVELTKYLIPSLGIIGINASNEVLIERKAKRIKPHKYAEAALCWVAELHAEAIRAGLWEGKKVPAHKKLCELFEKMPDRDRTAAICRQLRGRDAFWRADLPITINEFPEVQE